MDRWHPIPSHPGYFVDVAGNMGTSRQVGRGKETGHKIKEMKPSDRNSYWGISVRVAGKTCQRYVHRLVALTFIGEIPTTHVVDHINGDKRDNRLVNLRIVTRSFNLSGARRKHFKKSCPPAPIHPSDGNFRLVPGFAKYMCDRFGNVVRSDNGKLKKQHVAPTGYRKLQMVSDAGKGKIVQAHRIVAITWISNPDVKPVVNHINHDKLDCRACNLEWTTVAENSNAYQKHIKEN